jgi:hypothetical protein
VRPVISSPARIARWIGAARASAAGAGVDVDAAGFGGFEDRRVVSVHGCYDGEIGIESAKRCLLLLGPQALGMTNLDPGSSARLDGCFPLSLARPAGRGGWR